MMPISGSAGGGGPSGSSTVNDSAWNVTFGSGGINAGSSSELAGYLPFVVIAGVVLVAVAYFKGKRR